MGGSGAQSFSCFGATCWRQKSRLRKAQELHYVIATHRHLSFGFILYHHSVAFGKEITSLFASLDWHGLHFLELFKGPRHSSRVHLGCLEHSERCVLWDLLPLWQPGCKERQEAGGLNIPFWGTPPLAKFPPTRLYLL